MKNFWHAQAIPDIFKLLGPSERGLDEKPAAEKKI